VIAAIVIGLSVLFTLGLVVAWIVRPDLRSWIERPKHRFLESVREYDAAERDRRAPTATTVAGRDGGRG
jgi:hypothetical protein